MPCFDKTAAVQIARDYVNQLETTGGASVVIFSNASIRCDFGWAFLYEPKNLSARTAGNAPIIVDSEDRSMHPTGTAYPIEQYLEKLFGARRRPWVTNRFEAVALTVPDQVLLLNRSKAQE